MGYFRDPIPFLCIMHLGPTQFWGFGAAPAFPPGKGCQAKNKTHTPRFPRGPSIQIAQKPVH